MLLRPERHLVRFGAFDFDLASGDLWKAGRRIKLQNQPRQVLRMLVSRRGELVTRDELHHELWPDDTFVDFNNGLNVAIRKLREALGDVAPSSRFIETERARGYRFIAPVNDQPVPDRTPQEKLRPAVRRAAASVGFALASALVVVGTVLLSRNSAPRSVPSPPESAGPISLAVLPFSLAGAGGDDALPIGIADGIITRT